jgi:hypothetical protein
VLLPALEAIFKLADNTTTAAKLVRAEVHDSVVSAIAQHMDNAELVTSGCRILINLSYHGTTEMKTQMVNDSVCDVLLKVLKAHIDTSSDLVRVACITAQHLAVCPGNTVKLGECGICEEWQLH